MSNSKAYAQMWTAVLEMVLNPVIPHGGCCMHTGWCLHVQYFATSKQEEKSTIFGVGKDSSSAEDMVFIEHLRSLSCNYYPAQRRKFAYKTLPTVPEWAATERRIHPVYLATNFNAMKMQSLLDYQVTFNCFDF